jgi:hypothetical protein
MANLDLRLCVETQAWSYSFTCPECGTGNAQETASGTVAVLVSVGAPVHRWHLPAELSEAHGDAPAFTLDDVLDLHLLLDRRDWFDILRQRTQTGA